MRRLSSAGKAESRLFSENRGGYSAARAIRALDDKALAEIPILAMTANAFQEDVKAAMDAGMQAHIAKPVDVDKLTEALRSVLQPQP